MKIHTSLKPEFAGAVGLFSIDGMKTSEVDGQLLNKYKIHTTGIDWENIHGVRVTPHVYHSPKDLDRLVTAITAMSEKQAMASKQKKS
ncbi:hypothetical protein [Spirosoma telluris]|uniref:hypothetical protein n=1 Tax=Spirosoma telluris TaxID=2183553 RepID=UPI0039F261F1